MEFFGLTSYGVTDPIRSIIRKGYREPEHSRTPLQVAEELEKEGKKFNFSENAKDLDCYIGYADGFSCKSHDRLSRMRQKGILKPVGPCQIYERAATTFMQVGWWLESPDMCELLKNDDWYKIKHYPKNTSCMSRYYDKCKKIDKFFRM